MIASSPSPKSFGRLASVLVLTIIALFSAPTGAQFVGLTDDGLSHPPPGTGLLAYNTFVPSLAQGASYMDPVFGTTVLRVTSDHSVDDIYARNMWWSADETRFLHRNKNGTGFADYLAVIDMASGAVTHNGIPIGSIPGDEGFDPVDPNAV